MRILLRYLAAHYLLGCVPVLLTLVALFSFLALTEELDRVGQGLFETRDAVLVTLLTTPARLLELLPVTMLLGGLFGLGLLARNREIIVLRAAGFSLRQLALPLLVVTVAAAAVVVGLRLHVIPDLELRAAQLRAKTDATEIVQDPQGSGYWVRAGDQLLHIERLVDGQQLSGIEIYELDDRGQVERMIRAERGDIVGARQWLLHQVDRFDFRRAGLREESVERLRWQSGLSEKQTAGLVVPMEALSPSALYRQIRLLKRSDLDSHRYQVVFWQQISHPLAMVVMGLLSLPFVLGVQRGGALGRSALIGGLIGIGFFLAEQLLGHLSALLGLWPALAALLPETLMLLLLWRLLRAIDAH